MKKILLMLVFALAVGSVCAQEKDYTREGNTFTQVKSERKSKSKSIETPYKWKDSEGNEYPIFLSGNGSAYVNRVSKKSGKTYRKYLGEEMSREICKEMGVEYTYVKKSRK